MGKKKEDKKKDVKDKTGTGIFNIGVGIFDRAKKQRQEVLRTGKAPTTTISPNPADNRTNQPKKKNQSKKKKK